MVAGTVTHTEVYELRVLVDVVVLTGRTTVAVLVTETVLVSDSVDVGRVVMAAMVSICRNSDCHAIPGHIN